MRLTTCLASLALVASLACGSDSNRIELDTVCNADDGLFTALIDELLTCNPELVAFALPGVPEGDDLRQRCENLFVPYVDQGTVRYGTKKDAEACRQAIADADCESFDFDLIPECQQILLGQQPSGEGCESDVQCEGDAYCDGASDSSCGVCVDRKPDGATCQDETECQGRNCSDGSCLTPGSVGDDCASSDDCTGTLVCNHKKGTCQSADDWAEGDDCVPNTDDCAAFATNTYCNGQSEQCTAFLELGDDCAAGEGLCNFLQQEACDVDATKKCVGAQTVAAGEACNLFLGRVCVDGLLCSVPFGDGTCIAPAKPGDECDPMDDTPCPGTILLDCVDGTCQAGDYRGMCPVVPD